MNVTHHHHHHHVGQQQRTKIRCSGNCYRKLPLHGTTALHFFWPTGRIDRYSTLRYSVFNTIPIAAVPEQCSIQDFCFSPLWNWAPSACDCLSCSGSSNCMGSWSSSSSWRDTSATMWIAMFCWLKSLETVGRHRIVWGLQRLGTSFGLG